MPLIKERIGDGRVAGNIKGFAHGAILPFVLAITIHPMAAILYVIVVGGLYLFYFGAEKAEAKLMFVVSVLLEAIFLSQVVIDLMVGGAQ